MTFTARGLYASSSKEPRRGGPRALLLLGLVVACVGLLWVAALLVSLATLTTEEYASEHSGVETLRIGPTGTGTVEITEGEPGQEVQIRAEVTENLFSSAEADVTEDGTAVAAEARCGSWPAVGTCRVDFHAVVPPGIDVTVESGGGDVDLSGLEGEVEVSTSTGDIRVEGVTGDVTTRATTGDTVVTGVEGGLKAAATTGDIEVLGHDGSVALESTTGDMRVEGEGEVLTALNTTGTLDLLGFSAEAQEVQTTTGDVELLAGPGALAATTTTGDVNIRASEGFESVDVETTVGDVEVLLGSEAAPVRIEGSSSVGSREVEVATDPAAESRLLLTTTTGDVRVLPE